MKKLILLNLAILFSFSVYAQPLFDDASIKADKNKAISLDWYEEGWNNKKFEELIPKYFHQDWSDGNPIRADHFDGIEGILYMVRSYYQVFPDIQPTYKKVSTTAMVLFEMEGGKVKTTWTEMDLSGLLNQLTGNYATD